MTDKMHSKELGLVLGQQLLGLDDLHYGLWLDGEAPSLGKMAEAQQRYTDMLMQALPPGGDGHPRVIDIGCGTGHILAQLLDQGYRADGLVPAPKLAEMVRNHIAQRPGRSAQLFETRFEDFPTEQYRGQYDAALFSESFQYIAMEKSFPILAQIVKPGGTVVICDFFTTEHHGDGQPGDGSFGGGHPMQRFYEELQRHPFTILRDEDITRLVSPNIRMVDEILRHKLAPAGVSIDRYLSENYPKSWKLIRGIFRLLFRKRIEKQKYKYFSGYRTQEVFERYKTYRLIVLQRD